MRGSLQQPPSQVHPFPLAQHAAPGSFQLSLASVAPGCEGALTYLRHSGVKIKHFFIWAPTLVTQVFNGSLRNLVSYMQVSLIRTGSSKIWYSLCWHLSLWILSIPPHPNILKDDEWGNMQEPVWGSTWTDHLGERRWWLARWGNSSDSFGHNLVKLFW